MNIGNDRLWLAVKALATMKGDVRSRVVVAMSNIDKICDIELNKINGLRERVERLKEETSKKGPLVINGKVLKDKYQNTADRSKSTTYTRHAEEIVLIWQMACDSKD